MSSQFSNKVIILTGASSGIGKALAMQMAVPGAKLILAARRMNELTELVQTCEAKGAICHPLFLDVSDEASIKEFASKVKSLVNVVDVLVNNAGISQRSQAEETDIAVDRRIMEVNFFGQVSLTKSLWPLLCQSSHANIVLISSVVGTFGFPQRSAYSASKHALEGFFESWAIENKRENIHFTTVSPGRIQTNISLSALKADGTSHQVMDDGQVNGIPVDVCAKKIISGLLKNKRKIYVVQNEMILIILRKTAPFLYFWLVKKLKLS
ncbi:MAG: short chain dehydrogenase [Bacteroidetes bacterium B1(2017)]|nr:MAG: short chain dehydrogenase [Bacteroidetes bacterium B1(2017)]